MADIKIIKLEKLFFISDPIKLCQLPYPGHPKGCPNIRKTVNCPPHAPRLKDKYNLNQQCYFVIQPFDIAAQKVKMKALHPDWSDAQCACCLYWQNGVRKKLKYEAQILVNDLYRKHWGNKFCYELIPEAMGLDVFETAKYHGIAIERNPQNILYKIAFVGMVK